jgi:hypothetical protein
MSESYQMELLRRVIRKSIDNFDGHNDGYSNGSRDAYRCVLSVIKDIQDGSVTHEDDYGD